MRLRNPVIDYTPKGQKKEEEPTLAFKPCISCGAAILRGYYGRWENGGTCSKKCEQAYEGEPRENRI